MQENNSGNFWLQNSEFMDFYMNKNPYSKQNSGKKDFE